MKITKHGKKSEKKAEKDEKQEDEKKEDSEEKKENRDRAIQVVNKNKRAFISMAISNLLPSENEQKYVKEVNILKKRAYDFSAEGITAALKGMKIRTDHTELFAKFNGQKIVIAGKNDPVLEYNTIKSIAKRCKSKFCSLPDGHLSFLENQSELREILHLID